MSFRCTVLSPDDSNVQPELKPRALSTDLVDLAGPVSKMKYSRKHQSASLGLGKILFRQTFVCVLGHSAKFHTVVCGQKKFDTAALGA